MAEMPGEFELIRRLAARLGRPADPNVIGIGDDAAAIPHDGGWLLLTCDIAVEGRHFDLANIPPADVGWRAATANVSDIAACGGTPGYGLVSLGIPPHVEVSQIEELYDGFAAAAEFYGFDVVGGNITRAQQLIVDVFLTGRTERFVSRGGARPGDRLAVSGPLGDSAGGLEILQGSEPGAIPSGWGETLVSRHLRPRARIDLAARLREGAHAAIDISDGLSSELHHLAESSGVGLEVWRESLPCSPELMAHAERQGHSALRWALHGGEDYVLLFAYPPERDGLFNSEGITVIGEVSEGKGVTLSGEPLPPGGWDHLE